MSKDKDTEVVENVDVVETVDELVDLEPITIGEVTQLTCAAPGDIKMEDDIVWGT